MCAHHRIRKLIGDADHSSWCHSILQDLQELLAQPIESAKSSVIKLEKKIEGLSCCLCIWVSIDCTFFTCTIEEQTKLRQRWEAKNKVEANRKNLAEKSGQAMKERYCQQLKATLSMPEVHTKTDCHSAMHSICCNYHMSRIAVYRL